MGTKKNWDFGPMDRERMAEIATKLSVDTLLEQYVVVRKSFEKGMNEKDRLMLDVIRSEIHARVAA